jgi:subtilisin family serine protease
MFMKKTFFCSLFLMAFCVGVWAQNNSIVAGQLLVKINETSRIEPIVEACNTTMRAKGIEKVDTLYAPLGYYRVYFEHDGYDAKEIKSLLEAQRGVEVVTFNHVAKPRISPNDSLYANQWDMRKIQLESVWEKIQGGLTANNDTIVVAVAEAEGFNYAHPDIAPNIWRNRFEIPNDGKDNDNNGYIDDVVGWDFKTKSGKISADVRDHGAPVLGIIGAKGNNKKGVTGVNWNVKMMLLSYVDDEATSVAAYAYILKMRDLYNKTKGKQGAFIVVMNYSAGVDDLFPEQAPFWCKMFDELGKVGVLAVTATSNSTRKNVEKTGDIPSLCSSNHLIVVTNTDRTDDVLGACGTLSVDLSAPGGFASSSSTLPQASFTVSSKAGYKEFLGTSAATPHVAGTVALLYSFNNAALATAAIEKPSETALFIKDAILKGVDIVPGLATCTNTKGRLNAFKSFQYIENIVSTNVEDLTFRPNIIRDKSTIAIKTNGGDVPIPFFIYNALGQLIDSFSATTALFQTNYTLNIEVKNYQKGVYFLMFEDNEGKPVTQRFMVH